MALLSIITAPDPRLKVTSTAVEAVDDRLRKLMDDMLETITAAPGIGLAAVQVGVPERVIVVDVTHKDEPRDPIYLVNPEIVWVSDKLANYEEGCLSLPEQYAQVERPFACRVSHLDHEGEPRVLEAEGLLATCVQHEIDHLEGILFVDHLSTVRRSIILRKLLKARKSKLAASA
jgi:peptide deformylase